MKKKIFTMLFAVSLISFGASAQTIQQNIDKAAKDRNNAERAAKADVFIQKRTIYDSTQTQLSTTKVVSKNPEVKKVKYKKHKYKKKNRSSSK